MVVAHVLAPMPIDEFGNLAVDTAVKHAAANAHYTHIDSHAPSYILTYMQSYSSDIHYDGFAGLAAVMLNLDFATVFL